MSVTWTTRQMGCHSLSRSGKRGPHKGIACLFCELEDLSCFQPLLGGRAGGGGLVLRVTVSIWVPPSWHQHRENVHLFLVRQSPWLDKPGLFSFLHTAHPLIHISSGLATLFHFERFHPTRTTCPVQKSQVSKMEHDTTGQKSRYQTIRQANEYCLSFPLRNKALPPIFYIIFSQWEIIKRHPLLQTHQLALSSHPRPSPPSTQTFVGGRRLNRGDAMAQRPPPHTSIRSPLLIFSRLNLN